MRAGLQRMLSAREDSEHGYVAVFIALTLTIMLIFAAFAVDFGSWYTRSAELKRAADAAALAGVVWMPDFTSAQSAAEQAAAKNGFVDGVNNISVDVQPVEDNNEQLEVTIRDKKAKQFFSRLVTKSQSIGRQSTAEYVLGVPLGSPKNTFGSGNLFASPNTENFWAAVNGYCAGHENGDMRLAGNESWNNSSNSTSGGGPCNNGSAANDDYNARGYLYAVDLPQAATRLKLDVYDASYDRNASTRDQNFAPNSNTTTITTHFVTYNRNPTPLDETDDHIDTLQKNDFTVGSSSTDVTNYGGKWVNMETWTSPAAGRYYIRVFTNANETNSRGSNAFGLRVYTTNSWGTDSTMICSTITTTTCPQLHAVSEMSLAANLSGTTAEFYLAQIDKIHAGKTMKIFLFDPGEGASNIQIKNPSGAIAPFNWLTNCTDVPAPKGGCSGTNVTSLDVSGNGSTYTQPYSGLNSDSKFNDRLIEIDIKLPSTYNGDGAGNYWWKILYTVGSASSDRTTWSVKIVGDPVHLLQ